MSLEILIFHPSCLIHIILVISDVLLILSLFLVFYTGMVERETIPGMDSPQMTDLISPMF
jgi:hypothetical protein